MERIFDNVYLATDHAGYYQKEGEKVPSIRVADRLREHLEAQGYNCVDVGNAEYDKDDNYAEFMMKAAVQVAEDPRSCGFGFGGSGGGEQMAPNHTDARIRAGTFYGYSMRIIKWLRKHNDANFLGVGVREILEEAKEKDFEGNEAIEWAVNRIIEAADLFVVTPFEGGRHEPRIYAYSKPREASEE